MKKSNLHWTAVFAALHAVDHLLILLQDLVAVNLRCLLIESSPCSFFPVYGTESHQYFCNYKCEYVAQRWTCGNCARRRPCPHKPRWACQSSPGRQEVLQTRACVWPPSTTTKVGTAFIFVLGTMIFSYLPDQRHTHVFAAYPCLCFKKVPEGNYEVACSWVNRHRML